MSASIEVGAHTTGDVPQDSEEFQTIVQSIEGAQDPEILFPSSTRSAELATDEQGENTTTTQEDGESAKDEEEKGIDDEASHYWDASTMAPLSSASAAAIARLRAFKPPPFPLWDRLPPSRRAAVLLLLFADKRGDLRVVITMRAASMRSFSGHAALPGGKADSVEETPYQIARREAWEEIGLPMDDNKLPSPFRIEHLCDLPMNLARTELVVRPCVAFMHADRGKKSPSPTTDGDKGAPTADESLIPRLNAKEVAAVFSAPFHNFLRANDEVHKSDDGSQETPPPGKWYEGSWTNWHEEQWRMHFFYVPINNQLVAKPGSRKQLKAEEKSSNKSVINPEDDEDLPPPTAALARGGDEEESERYKVWGMTARILVDAATVAYGEEPEFEHNSHFGDERMIMGLDKLGMLGEKTKKGSVFTQEDLKRASEAAKKASEASKM
ncbi:8-oxo-dGTP diphosphatase [Neurospora sp. IMI 360204]|nr:8-oxo-dGTP diphosphatase [Neurospora sp. IMI 360204]